MTPDHDGQKFAAARAYKDKIAGTTLKDLFAADPKRFERYHVELGDLLFDYSKHRVDDGALQVLLVSPGRKTSKASATGCSRAKSSTRPNTARPCTSRCATFQASPILVDGVDVMPAVEAERAKVARLRDRRA